MTNGLPTRLLTSPRIRRYGDTTGVTPQPQMYGSPRGRLAYAQMLSAADAASRKAFPQAQTASTSGVPMPTVLPKPRPAMTPPPSQPSGFMDAFRQPLPSPVGQAISQAAIAGARASDWSPTPVSLGRVLAEMGAAATGGYQAGLKEERAAEAADFARRMQLMQFAQKEREIGGTLGKEERAQKLQETRLRRDLRKDFEDDAKYFAEAQQFWRDVVNYSKPEQSSAADLALVFSYMKMLDPDSVVREGEQMQVQGLGGVGAKARALLSKIGVSTEGTYDGGMLLLTKEIRSAIRDASALRYADLAKSQAALERYTADEGSRAGLSTDFFKSKIKGDGDMKRPYVVNTLDDLPETAKSGDYAVVNGVFMQIREQD